MLDVGLGLAYNAIHTLRAWHEGGAKGPLEIVSLEIDADLVAALASGVAPWQANWDVAALGWSTALRRAPAQADGTMRWHAEGAAFAWTVVVADASTLAALPAAARPFDFVWQDAFSPQKSPSLWTEGWFAKVRAVCAPGATLMTYSVARPVREALAAARFEPVKIAAAPGHKRQWLKATAS